MCGIFGVVGSENAYEEIKEGLERISYRGYDSAGIVTYGKVEIEHFSPYIGWSIKKVEGHPENLPDLDLDHTFGIGHDRWSTHSAPTRSNAHPYNSMDGKISLVHNGIIENYPEVKQFLKDKGFVFHTKTDTEVLPNLIQYYILKGHSIQKAIMHMTKDIRGAYAIAFLHKDHIGKIFIARHGSPICVGRGDGKHYISSDISSLPSGISEVTVLENEKFAIVTKDKVSIKTFKGGHQKAKWEEIEEDTRMYTLEPYSTYMEKEIAEQPFYLKNAINGRVIQSPPEIRLAGISEYMDDLLAADEIVFAGCGSAFLAAQIAAHAMENIGRVRSRAINAGELQYFNPIITDKTVLVPISQSGETADTIGCIDFYKNKGAKVLGVVNVVNSTISRMVDAGIYIRAGQERSVASTKAFMNQIFNLILIAYMIGNKNGLSNIEYLSFIAEVEKLPGRIDSIIGGRYDFKEVARDASKFENILCIGRGLLETMSYEAALKIKEISYIHAEGYSAAELKHGPLALISEDMLTIAFVQSGILGDKTISNLHEIKSRNGELLIITSRDRYLKDKEIEQFGWTLFIDELDNQYLNSLLYLVVAQLLAYYIARELERPIDRPRNLAKSVTVE
jgi:glucosamine--fructose-6-phosphate aminotransferase (isomerizing)